jgi:pterin-4a-carbinolamine dehydratase
MNLETAIEQLELINEAIAVVTKCAKQSQKISHNKHIEDKYTSALFQLELYRTSAQVYLTRIKIIGK